MEELKRKSRAYDEALEKAKRLYEKGTITESLCHIFPELKNEDERVRKELIELIGCMHDADPRKKGWIDWLEKQGDKPACDWSEKDEEMLDFCCNYLDNLQTAWLQSLKQRIGG